MLQTWQRVWLTLSEQLGYLKQLDFKFRTCKIEEKGILFQVSETGERRLHSEDMKICLGGHDNYEYLMTAYYVPECSKLFT